ncbi:MAG: multidrug transporter, partial [Clostridiales bacterium]|nr:multidrug transporter [Clostridiales bacterium]
MDKIFRKIRDKARGKKEKTAGERRKGYTIADFIVDNNRKIFTLVAAAVIGSIFLSLFVGVNYDLTKYLPETAPSKIAIEKMRDTFGYPGTGRLMLKDVTLYEAKDIKDEIEMIDGVDQVIWADMTESIYTSSDFIRQEDIEEYYKDGCAVMDITFEEGDTSKVTHRAIDDIEELVGEKGCIVGMSPVNKFTEENVEKEMSLIL